MSNLVKKKELTLYLIPDEVKRDFEHMVLDAYFDSKYHDVYNISIYVDHFAIYAASLEETGDLFKFVDDPDRVDENAELTQLHFDAVNEDVREVLNYHYMFHASTDIGNHLHYDFVGDLYHCPWKEVW